jgi:hypothetical protein
MTDLTREQIEQISAIINKHRRHVEMSPGAGKKCQDYALAVIGDIESDTALRAAEPSCKDGGQCGVGGYCVDCPKRAAEPAQPAAYCEHPECSGLNSRTPYSAIITALKNVTVLRADDAERIAREPVMVEVMHIRDAADQMRRELYTRPDDGLAERLQKAIAEVMEYQWSANDDRLTALTLLLDTSNEAARALGGKR